MKAIFRITRSFAAKLAVAALVVGPAAWSLAPAQDPFAEAGKAPAGAPGAAAPAAGAPVAGGKNGAKAKTRLVPIPEKKPLVLEYLDQNKPTTPEQMLKAAEITLNIGRADESKKYLASFLAAKPEDATLAALGKTFGPDFFLRLQREKDIQPEGTQTATAVLDAMRNAARDPARIAGLIAELGSADAGQRALARHDLAEGSTDAALALVAALANADQASLHTQVQVALLGMKLDSEQPLVAALESDDEGQLVKVIDTLGAMASRAATPRLVRLAVDGSAAPAVRTAAADALVRIVGSAPKPEEAQRYLHKQLDQQLERANVLQPELEDAVKVWQWDAMNKAPVALELPPGDAALLEARQIAAELYRVAPKNPYAARMRLMTALEADKLLGGLDRPLPQGDGTAAAMAAEAGPALVSDVLADAMRRGRVVAAVAAAETLATIGDTRALASPSDGEESPLALALRHPDRRLRITAALAIARIRPRESFTGASRVTETLAHFAGTGGGRRVLIGHPRSEDGQTLVAYANENSYEAEVAPTGRAVEQKIVENADYEFLFVSDTIAGPEVKELVQWLRRDYRTARLPVGVLARGDTIDALRDDLEEDRLTYVFPAIADSEVAAELVLRLERIAGRNLIGRDERMDMAVAALDALAGMVDQPPTGPKWDVLRHESQVIRALAVPGLTPKAARVLGLLGTARSQTALVDFASHFGRPIEDRQAAAAALAEAVKRRGPMLTRQQIRQQYDRYNASETQDAQTQAVLGSILDIIESRAVAAAGTNP
jgi:hypothetical protein